MGGLSNGPIPDHHVLQTEGLQIGDHRLSTSCGVVERPDHHWDDDHLLQILESLYVPTVKDPLPSEMPDYPVDPGSPVAKGDRNIAVRRHDNEAPSLNNFLHSIGNFLSKSFYW